MAAFDEVTEVEQNGDRPGTYGNIGEDRMKGMTRPGAVSQGLEVAPWFAEQLVGATDNLLKEIGDRLEPALPVDETVDDVVEHRRLLSEYAARQNSMGSGAGSEPTRDPPPGPGCLVQANWSEANRIAWTRLGQQREVGADDGRNHGVATGRLMIDVQDDQVARWGDLNGTLGHWHGQDLCRLQPQRGRLEPETHAVDLRGNATGRRAQAVERGTGEAIRVRARDNADLPWTLQRQAMRR